MSNTLRLALGLGFVLGLPAALAAGCFLDREGACSLDGECPPGDACTGGRCQPKPCKSDAECGVSNECVTHTCVDGTCKAAFRTGPLPAEQQTPNDCLQRSCDGRGNVQTLPDSTDVPLDDGNACTDEVCGADGGEHPFSMAGAACLLTAVDDGVCDGAGTCVQCVASASCTSGDHPRCWDHHCVSCDNGVQDGDEQEVDCGGACPQQCALGPCTMDADCKSGLQCSGGLCRWANGHSCTNDSECKSLLCAGPTDAKTCQACTTNNQCASQHCSSGACSAP
jgi:hypothetical protein